MHTVVITWNYLLKFLDFESLFCDNVLARNSDLSVATVAGIVRFFLSVDPNRPADAGFHYRTTWSVSTEINCPMTGIHSVICQTTGNDVCPPDSAVKVEGSRMTIYVPTLSKKYPSK